MQFIRGSGASKYQESVLKLLLRYSLRLVRASLDIEVVFVVTGLCDPGKQRTAEDMQTTCRAKQFVQ